MDFSDGSWWRPGQVAKTPDEILAAQVFAAHDKAAADVSDEVRVHQDRAEQAVTRKVALTTLRAEQAAAGADVAWIDARLAKVAAEASAAAAEIAKKP